MNVADTTNTHPFLPPDRPRDSSERKITAGAEKHSSSNNTRQEWWRKSVVRRSISSIEPDLQYVVSKSVFLQNHVDDDLSEKGIALFHRSEIQTGELLGRGGFSLVLEITAFILDDEVSRLCTPEEQIVRERYARTVFQKGQYKYCIKHLQERLLQSPKDFQCAAADLAVEAAYMSALNHPNILSIRGLPVEGLKAWNDGHHDGYFIVADRLHGTLDKRITEWKKSQSPSITQRANYALQLADALRYLHRNQIIFRDLKPHNIGFTKQEDFTGGDQVKLFDFGLCREVPHGTQSNEMFQMSGVGTRRYMAPEIINGDGAYNLKADVYSWSMVTWEMLSLVKPYAPYSVADHRREVCQGGERPILDLQWPAWIHILLRDSWDESVDDRFSMDQVWYTLDAILTVENECNYEDLNFTNHDDAGMKKFSMPFSPTGVSDFSSDLNSENRSTEFTGSIEQSIELFGDSSPPPAPKKQAAYVSLSEVVVNSMAFNQSEDELSGLCSLDLDDSFAAA